MEDGGEQTGMNMRVMKLTMVPNSYSREHPRWEEELICRW
jgi:hypothetical protein